MQASVIIIGDEILLGQVTDTNSGAIARALAPLGIEVVSIATVGDNGPDIRRAVGQALSATPLVLTTGGLGPTKDDITKTVLTDIFGGELVFDPAVEANVKEIFRRRHLDMNRLTASQAMVPSSCRVIQNHYGTAPLMWFERDGRVLVSMPGVPFETEGMLPEVVELVAARFSPGEEFHHRTVIVTGITESALAERLADFESQLGPDLHLAYLPTPGLIRLRLDGCGAVGSDIAGRHAAAYQAMVELLGLLAIYQEDASPAAILLELMRRQGLTLCTAESCTGGNIAHRITEVAGSSDVFLGGIVSYANGVKQGLLGVRGEDLEAHGAVSRQVVEQMAAGACRATGATCAMATSGIAGPGGGTPDKPVGTVWMAWAVNDQVTSHLFHFPGNRGRVIDRATNEALLGLIKLLQ